MNVLIDTNILIPLEDTARALDPSLAEMCRLSEQNGHILFVHPAQAEDIRRDRNENRRNIVLSRLQQYQTIPSPPSLTNGDLERYGWRQTRENDQIDNLLLHALCRGAVHFLVTNDKDIHKKAKAAHFQEQVHRLDQFLAFLKSQSGLSGKNIDVPERVGICGFDNIELSSQWGIELTTIAQNAAAIGKRSAEILFSILENPEKDIPTEHITIPVELIPRKTTMLK